MERPRIKVLIIGGFPPPVTGTSARLDLLVKHEKFSQKLDYCLLDTIDRRSVDNMGRFEFTNVFLAIRHSLQLAFILSKKNIDVVFLSIAQNKWGFIRDSIFIWVSALFQIRTVAHLDGGYFKDFYNLQNKLFKKYIYWTCRRISSGIVLGQSLCNRFSGLIENIHIVHAGVPIIGSGSRDKSVKRVLFLGSLFKSKGYIDTLKSIPSVVKEFPDVQFVFVGKEGKSIEEIMDYSVADERESLVKNLKLYPYVQFLGPLYNLERDREFQCADIFVFPTYYRFEAKPAVVMQAMSAELPVITTHFPGSEDLIKDGENGFYVQAQHPEQLALKILILLNDPGLRKQMGTRNRNIIEKKYAIDKHVLETVTILLKNK